MTLYGRSSRWAAALALGLAGLIGLGAATVPAAPAGTAANAFELTLEGRMTFDDGRGCLQTVQRGTFGSRAPFCATGTIVDAATCGRTEHVAVHVRRRHRQPDGLNGVRMEPAAWGNTTWRILDGSGSYAGLRGSGSLRGELLGDPSFRRVAVPGGAPSRASSTGMRSRRRSPSRARRPRSSVARRAPTR